MRTHYKYTELITLLTSQTSWMYIEYIIHSVPPRVPLTTSLGIFSNDSYILFHQFVCFDDIYLKTSTIFRKDNMHFSLSHKQVLYVLRSNSLHHGLACEEETIGYNRFPLIWFLGDKFYFIFYFLFCAFSF